jgi:F420-dependent oxidoreductase-like protein
MRFTPLMRFALKTSPQQTTWADMLAVWQAADEIELFESAWTFDHFYPIFTEELDGDCMDGWITLTALAQATRRLRVGVLVTATPYRHPAVLAKMASTLDIISGGRLELGLGAGWNVVEARAYHLDLLEDLTERFDAFDETCAALVALLTQERTTYTGRFVQLTDAYCNPKPIQRPHPPICIGGQGEQRTLGSVARFAQHWNFPGGTVDEFATKLDVLRAHCAEVGRDASEITVSAHLIGLRFGTGVDAVVEEAKRYADAGLDLGIVYLPTPLTPTVLEPLADALAELAG